MARRGSVCRRGRIDGHKLAVPKKGDLEYPLDPGKHRVSLTREGYEPIECELTLKEGERCLYPLQWKLAHPPAGSGRAERPSGVNPGVLSAGGDGRLMSGELMSFDDWLQDPEAAKKKAAAEGKDLLIAVLGSDPISKGLAYEVLLQRKFYSRVHGRYVLVWIDAMRDPRPNDRIQDPARNLRVLKQFRVQSLPTVIAADAQGLPFAVFAGHDGRGLDGFMTRLTQSQAARAQRDQLFREIETAPGGAKLAAIAQALRLLGERKLLPYYGRVVDAWLAVARQYDSRNVHGVYEVLFQIQWVLALIDTDINHPDAQLAARLIADLDAWKEKCRFHNADLAARMHLYAASLLLATQRGPAAQKYLEDGLGYQPNDPVLREEIASRMAKIRGVGVGTGFVIAPGMVLTNYHVIEGPGKTAVTIPGGPDPVPAQVFAQDAERDIALLKFEVPEDLDLAPLSLSTAPAARGEEVGAFGYPGTGTVGASRKVTRGVISATADESTRGMLLLDLRINPGNSGGPLCNVHAEVVGMVSAKSVGGFGVDSYGIALPVSVLQSFLAEYLPDYAKRAGGRRPETAKKADKSRKPKSKPGAKTGNKPGAEKGKPVLDWVEVDRIVGPSVVMIVRTP